MTEKFIIGDSRLDIDGCEIFLKKKRYSGPKGLYELLFKNSLRISLRFLQLRTYFNEDKCSPFSLKI